MRYPHYPAYRESGVPWIGAVPKHWKVRRLKNLATIRFSNVDKLTVEGQPEVQLCNYVDVYKNEKIRADMPFMAATASPDQIMKFGVMPGDVLITKDSETPTDIAVPTLIAEEMPGVVCGYHLAMVRPRPNQTDGGYLFRAFQASPTAAQYSAVATGITRFGLSTWDVGSAWFAEPSIDEQRAIANFLDCETVRIDALIAKKRELIERLKEQRAALITHAVTKGLDSKAVTQDSGKAAFGAIPCNWEIKPFRYCARIAEGQVDPEEEPYIDMVLMAPDYIEPNTGKVLSTETAREQAAISGKYYVRKGDIVYSKIRPALNKLCIATDDWLCSADMYPIRPASILDAKFLFYVMLSDVFVSRMVDESMRVAMPKVNRETMKATQILVPPIEEQREITAHLDQWIVRLDRATDRVQSAITMLDEQRAALITEAVTGKIDVREALHHAA